MARPKSEDKRNAILDAATRLFAERGLTAAPTSEISKQAGVAEGTLFTYFRTKDDLINSLYREIKLELADAMMSDFPRKKNVGTRMRHVWDRYVNWGIANPKQRKVLGQLTVSEVVVRQNEIVSSHEVKSRANLSRPVVVAAQWVNLHEIMLGFEAVQESILT